eukprot:14959557-Heterocapsa_arctica.AAC.1
MAEGSRLVVALPRAVMPWSNWIEVAACFDDGGRDVNTTTSVCVLEINFEALGELMMYGGDSTVVTFREGRWPYGRDLLPRAHELLAEGYQTATELTPEVVAQ